MSGIEETQIINAIDILKALPSDVATYTLLFLDIVSIVNIDAVDEAYVPTTLWMTLLKRSYDENLIRLVFEKKEVVQLARKLALFYNHGCWGTTKAVNMLGPACNEEVTAVASMKPASEMLIHPDHNTPVVDFSSCDRPEESATLTLTPSHCYSTIDFARSKYDETKLPEALMVSQFGIRAQMACGCTATKPCYWSSAANTDVDMVEHFTVDLQRPFVSTLSGFGVRCYQAFAHPTAPVYAPRSVQIELHSTLARGCYYKSDLFPCEQSRVPQRFELPVPQMVLPHTHVKFLFVGAAQRQTIGEYNGQAHDDYYICISSVELTGLVDDGRGDYIATYKTGERVANTEFVAEPNEAEEGGEVVVRARRKAVQKEASSEVWKLLSQLKK
jgi:hypothetical protein